MRIEKKYQIFEFCCLRQVSLGAWWFHRFSERDYYKELQYSLWVLGINYQITRWWHWMQVGTIWNWYFYLDWYGKFDPCWVGALLVKSCWRCSFQERSSWPSIWQLWFWLLKDWSGNSFWCPGHGCCLMECCKLVAPLTLHEILWIDHKINFYIWMPK